MKRLVYIISTFLILTGMYGGSVGAEKDDSTDSTSSIGSTSHKGIFYCVYQKGTRIVVTGNSTGWRASAGSATKKKIKATCGEGNEVFWDEDLADAEQERLEKLLKEDSSSGSASTGNQYPLLAASSRIP